MLISRNGIGTNKAKFIYECDRCKRQMTSKGRYVICVQEPNTVGRRGKWDLCGRCYRVLEQNIERGGKKWRRSYAK